MRNIHGLRHEFWLNNDEVNLYVATSQSGGEGEGDTQTDIETYRQMNLIGQADRPMGIETTHPIIFGFSWIRIQSEFLWENEYLNSQSLLYTNLCLNS